METLLSRPLLSLLMLFLAAMSLAAGLVAGVKIGTSWFGPLNVSLPPIVVYHVSDD